MPEHSKLRNDKLPIWSSVAVLVAPCAHSWAMSTMDPDLSTKAFGEDVIDSLESYDLELDYDTEWDDEGEENIAANDGDLARKLIFPYDKNEPNLSDDQLMELDSIADGIELQRLSSMNVLLGSSCLEGVSYKQLSTRFVRSWRDKEMEVDGKLTRIWLRRSRFVAREFSWLSDDKQSMFSPASSSANGVFAAQSR